MAEQQTRRDIFSRADLLAFRERQMADLEQRSFQTMSSHAKVYGNNDAPTVQSELQDGINSIQEFAKKQVDKMKGVGAPDEKIRLAVLGAIQNASIVLAPDHKLKPVFNKMIENVNNNIERHIHQRMDLRQNGMTQTR